MLVHDEFVARSSVLAGASSHSRTHSRSSLHTRHKRIVVTVSSWTRAPPTASLRVFVAAGPSSVRDQDPDWSFCRSLIVFGAAGRQRPRPSTVVTDLCWTKEPLCDVFVNAAI